MTRRILIALFMLVMPLSGLRPASAAANDPFTFLASGFTQALYSTHLPGLTGVAFASDGDPLMLNSDFYRVDSQSTISEDGTTYHPASQPGTPKDSGIGLANSLDGGVYANTGVGVEKLDPTTGATIAGPAGAEGNGLGIALDPVTHNLVYSSVDGLSFVSPDLAHTGTFSAFGGADGITFDPTGSYLFAADNGGDTIDVINRSGAVVQQILLPAGSGPDGMAFHAASPKFVVVDDNDGTMMRLDFAGDDYTQPPTETKFADGGFRGDLSQVGKDGCLYVSEDGSRFADGTQTDGSLVQICGGFAAPGSAATTLTANPSIARVLPTADVYLTLSATLTSAAGPLAGKTIAFTAGGQPVCSGITDPSGTASCGGIAGGVVPSVLALGYDAAFAGGSGYVASDAHGTLVVVDGTPIP